MSNIFEELDRIINPALYESAPVNEDGEKLIREIPTNPDMETADQGIEKARQKIAKYFYELSINGGGPGMPPMSIDDIDLPDDWLAPKIKGKLSGKIQDKNFERNKVLWDKQEELERLQKEIEMNMDGEDSDFDDFDYRDNDFGDEDTSDLDTSDMDPSGGNGGGDDSQKSEKDKLQDAINDAINKLRDEKQTGGDDSGNDSGSQSGGDQKSGSQSGGSQSGSQNGGSQSGSQDGSSTSSSGGKKSCESAKDRMLDTLQKAIEDGDSAGAESASRQLEAGDDGSGKLAGESLGKVGEDALNRDMKKAGVSDDEIKEMEDNLNDKSLLSEISESEMEELKREVVNGLEKKCKKKGGSALAKTVVRHALKKKIDNDEWRNMLKLFLKSKAVMNGDMAKAKNRAKYGHKNHLWRDAVLPTMTNGHGQIQNIYCFVDFSGSVNKDLVFTFLGKVIDLCAELNYTNVVVYGFGEKIVLPREITNRMLKTQGKDVVLSQTWDYIDSQNPGCGTENFRDVANEIMEIRKKQKDAVYLIFGDAFWADPQDGPMCLKEICGERLLDRICVLTYYMPGTEEFFAGFIAILKEMVGLKSVITSKASSIRD